jgi:hypothetical protein
VPHRLPSGDALLIYFLAVMSLKYEKNLVHKSGSSDGKNFTLATGSNRERAAIGFLQLTQTAPLPAGLTMRWEALLPYA